MPRSCIDQLINLQQEKIIVGIGLIEVCLININPPFFIDFLDYDHIS